MAGLLVGMLALALGLWLWRRSSTFGRGLGAASILLALAIVASPILDRDASDAATSANAATDSEFSEQRLQQLLNEGQPVFVNVTADWCITCLANERSTLGTDTVLKAMADKSIVYLRADWTNYDPSIADFLARFNRNGIPLYLVYSGRNGEEPEILPQILTPGIVLDAFTDI